jgi:hypothetical protein
MSAKMSIKPLTDTQFVLLSAAAQRADRALVPPERLKGNAAQKAAEKLVGLGLVEEIRARGEMPVWRRNEDGRAMALRITKRGLKMILADENEREPKTQMAAPARRPATRMTTKMRPAAATARSDEGDLHQAPPTKPRGRASVAPSNEPERHHEAVCQPSAISESVNRAPDHGSPSSAPVTRAGTKQAQILALLQRPEGVTIEAMMQATGWLPHSVRGFLSAVVRRKLGLTIATDKVDGRRVFRIAPGAGAPSQPAA